MKKTCMIFFSVLLLLVLGACGNSNQKDAAENSKPESSSIEIIDASGQKITFKSVPKSIATLSSGDLDILLALGANVTGRPTASGPVENEIKDITEIGNPHQPNFEKIAEVHPDVLVASIGFEQQAANIERQGTKVVYTQADSIEDIQKMISMYGKMFKKEVAAENLNKSITEKIASEEDNKTNPVRALLVYGAPGTYLAALPNSLSGDLLEKVGGENIAADFNQEKSYPQYASLSIEKIIERNPQVVMLITHGDPNGVKAAFEKEMKKNAAWKNLDAVKSGHVIILPANLFGTNPGTKVTEALEVMKKELAKVQ